MAIWMVYFSASFLLFVAFYQLPHDLLTIPLDLSSIPLPFNIILAVGIVLAAFAIAIGLVSAVAVGIIHTLWVLTGALFLSRSVRKTWEEVHENELFEENGPSWPKANQERWEHEADDPNEGGGDAVKLIDVENEDERNELYQRLDRDSGDIRLLKPIIDSAMVNALHFEIIQKPLHSVSGSYTALSYRWGEGPRTETIYIKRPLKQYKRIRVHRNLCQALRRLTDRAHELVDALCINQDDLVERSAQVVRMRAIFTEANIVIAWIPEELGSDYQQRTWVSNGSTSGTASISQGQHIRPSIEAGAYDAVLINKYWCRLWIIQEFAVAGTMQVLTDSKVIEEEHLRRLVDNASAGSDTGTLEQVRSVMDVRTRWQKMVEPSLLDLLLRTSASFSDRRHDRVFGILSMARDGRRFLVEPSYGISERKLSMHMTRFYLQSRDSHLDIILLGAHFAEKSGLPSWCPDYFGFDNLPPDRRLVEYVRDVFGRVHSPPKDTGDRLRYRPLFQATGESACRASLKDNKILRSPARRLGVINSLGWIASDQKSKKFPSKGLSTTFDAQGGDIASALWSLLLTLSQRDFWDTREVPWAADVGTDNDYMRCTYPYIYFMLLTFGGGTQGDESGAPNGWYAQWLHANQRFRFGQRTLHEHARDMRSVLGYRRFWRWAESVKDTLRASVRHGELRDLQRIHQPLRTVAQEHMRLMSLTIDGKGVIALAHSAAREEDEVFLLPGCSVPVILRKVPDGNQYSLVGDAIVPGAMFGEQWTIHTGSELDEVEII